MKLFRKKRAMRRTPPLMERRFQMHLPGAGPGALAHAALRPPDADVKDALDRMRARSRQEVQNGDYLAGFLLAAQRNVVGAGLRLRSRHDDEKVREAVEREWGEWTADCGWWRMEMLALASLLVDGEIVARLEPRGRWGLAVQLLDAALIDTEYCARRPNGATVEMGIERDAQGATTAYWLRSREGSSYQSRKRVRLPADWVTFAAWRQQVGQTRGVPYFAPALLRLEQTRHYETSELVAARLGTRKHGYIASDPNAEIPYADPLPDPKAKEKEGKSSDQSALDQSRAIWQAAMQDGGGVQYGVEVTMLDPGQSYQSEDWPHPNASFGDFVQQQLRGVAAGLGTSYHALSGDLSRVNFSAGRIGEIESRQTWLHLRRFLIAGFHRPIFKAWTMAASLRGLLPGLPAELARADWVGAAFQHIQPREQSRANESDIRNRLRSVSEIIRESGREPEDVFAQIANDKERLDDLGIGFPGLD